MLLGDGGVEGSFSAFDSWINYQFLSFHLKVLGSAIALAMVTSLLVTVTFPTVVLTETKLWLIYN